MINPDIKIWCTYHMPEQITEYNIKQVIAAKNPLLFKREIK